MTVQQYQESELSSQLAELLNSPALSIALQVCDQVSPANGGSKVWDQPHLAHIQLGLDRGYNLYPQMLKTLAQKPKKQEEVQPTYEIVKEEDQSNG